MSDQYEESILDTLSKVYSPLIKVLSVLGLFTVAFVGITSLTDVGGGLEGYEFQEFIARDFNISTGNPDSRVTLVHLYDLQCPVCAGYDPTMTQLKSEFGGSINIVYKHNPLQDLHPQAPQAARAVQAAAKQDVDLALEYSSLLLSRQNDGFNSSNLREWAEEVGLDGEKWQEDRRSTEIRNEVRFDEEDIRNSNWETSLNNRGGKAIGQLAGTPANVIYVDEEFYGFVAGSEPLQAMRGHLNAALESIGEAAVDPASPVQPDVTLGEEVQSSDPNQSSEN